MRFVEGDPAIRDTIHIEEGCPVRFIDAFVDCLDMLGLGFMHSERFSDDYDDTAAGRPPWNPRDLLRYQLKNGQLPAVISRGWKRLFNQRCHSWTADTEILAVLGIMKYAKITGDFDFLDDNRTQIDNCVKFVKQRLNPQGIIAGADWRDAIINHHERKFLLCNQILLVEMYNELGMMEDSRALKETILALFSRPRLPR